MKKIKILAIAPYEGMAEILETISKYRRDVEITIRIGNLEKGLDLAKKAMESSTFDIAVSRGGTAELLKRHLPLPVIEIPFTVYDLLCSLKMLDNYKGKFAITGFQGITKNAKILCDVLQKDVDIFTFQSQNEVSPLLKKLKDDNFSLVICDMISYNTAHTIGLNALFVSSSEDSINTAINDAIQFVNASTKMYQQIDLLKQIFLTLNESFVLIDCNKNIVFHSLEKETAGKSILVEIESNIDRYVSSHEQYATPNIEGSVYAIQNKPLVFEDEIFSLLTIASAPTLFDADDKTITLFSDYHEMSSINTFDNTASLVGDTSGLLEKFAATTLPVLITGESGTGKEKTAALLYRYGSYHNKPYYVIDCSLMTDKKWKSLLTNTNSPFSQVHCSIHIKSIEYLTSSQLEAFYEYIAYSKFLTRNRVIFSLTDTSKKSNDIRNYLTNRLSCLSFPLTPLRERQEDIGSIATLYINEMNASLGKQIIGFEGNALKMITEYSWPQNLDQFHRILKELIIITDTAYITSQNVKLLLSREKGANAITQETISNNAIDLNRTLDDITFDIINQVLVLENGNKDRAAKRLGISRTTLWRTLKNKE